MACGWFRPDPAFLDEPPADSPVRPVARAPASISLMALEPTTLELPPSNRPGGTPAPEGVHPLGSFRTGHSRNRAVVYKASLPFHDSLLPTKDGGTHVIGNHPPPGLVVTHLGKPLSFERKGKRNNTWGFDRKNIYIGLGPDDPRPEPGEVQLTFPKATQTENGLNFLTSGQDATSFTRRTAIVGTASHRGLYLPAPAQATFTLTVPPQGRLAFEGGVLPPSILVQDVQSDGARVRVAVRHQGTTTDIGTLDVQPKQFRPGRFDLSAFAGQTVDLLITTEPGSSSDFDYVLLEGPVVYTPSESPQRVVLVFVDTLRPDHLGFNGYSRETTPLLDRWAKHAAVFPEARSVAPWTLPSARAVLTGAQPESWYQVASLPARLAEAGWRTEARVGNAFLSHAFDLHTDWDRYGYEHLRSASSMVDEGVAVLEAHNDRDVLLMVHFMEPHLPYTEPRKFRGLFAPNKPEGLDHVSRSSLRDVRTIDDDFEEIREYVIGRYDQNVRTVDDRLLELLHAAGNGATVVLFSDHGEEFWEHREFEHGHAFWDEILGVTLAIRSPYLPAGRHSEPVSLLDVTPTVLELAGLSSDVPRGQSLVPLAWGDTGVAEQFAARPHGFGRPLYNGEGWGVVVEDRKWIARDGQQQVVPCGPDDDELTDVAKNVDLSVYPPHLQESLGRPVSEVWRVTMLPRAEDAVEVTLSHPDGFERAWLGYDPRGRSLWPEPELRNGRVHFVVPPDQDAPPPLYVLPVGNPREPDGLAITVVGRELARGAKVEGRGEMSIEARRQTITSVGDGRFSAMVDLAWVPQPAGVEVRGFHPELEAQLKDLGYVDP